MSASGNDRNGSAAAEKSPRQKSSLMLWVVAAFLLLATAWTALFVVAAKNPVATVPLQKSSQP